MKQELASAGPDGPADAGPYAKHLPHSRQITTPVPHHANFYRLDALSATQPTASKH